MADETIVIEIVDKIDNSLLKKLKELSNLSSKADLSVERLKQSQLRTAIASERLGATQNRTSITAKQLAAATDRAALAHLRLENAQKRNEAASKSVGKSFFNLGNALKGALAYIGIREIGQLGNAYVDLQNKLRVVTTSEEQLATVSNRVFDIANRTRTPVEETAKAFSRFDLALIQLGGSQEETLRMTETINKALVVSGANTGEQSAALLQLSQAFNKGKLDGDEFRTVMELMPTVADAIAKQLGVTRGELLKLAPQGKITADVMRKALSSSAEEIDKKFAKTIPTLNQAFSVLQNIATQALGEIEKKTGVLGGLTGFVFDLGKGLKDLTPDLAMLVNSVKDLATEISNLTPAGASLFTFLRRIVQGVSVIFAALADSIRFVKVLTLQVTSAVLQLFSLALKSSYAFANAVNEITKKAGVEVVTKDQLATVKTYEYVLKGLVNVIDTQTDSVLMQDLATEKWLKSLEDAEFGVGKLAKAEDKLREGRNVTMPGAGDSAGAGSSKRRKSQNPGIEKLSSSGFEREVEALKSYMDKIDQLGKIEDPLAEVNKSLDDEWKILQKVGREQEVEIRLQQIRNDLLPKGVLLVGELADKYKQETETLIYKNLVNQEQNNIYSETLGRQEELKAKLEATNLSFANGAINTEMYSVRLAKIAVEMANLRIQMGEGNVADIATASLGRLTETYQGVASGLTDTFGDFFQSLNDGFSDTIGKAVVQSENLGDAVNKVANTAVSNLISSLVKLGIQYLLNAALGETISKTALATQTALSSAAAATTAVAWAPAAAMVSLASFGANSAPASAGIVATSALAEGMALASVAGFEKGGTVLGGEQLIRVNERGTETVMNAKATANYGPMLNAMNEGKQVGNGVNISIVNYGTSKEFEIQKTDDEHIKIIARDEARQVVRRETPGLVASEIGNPNSSISKSLGQNIKAPRQRN